MECGREHENEVMVKNDGVGKLDGECEKSFINWKRGVWHKERSKRNEAVKREI